MVDQPIKVLKKIERGREMNWYKPGVNYLKDILQVSKQTMYHVFQTAWNPIEPCGTMHAWIFPWLFLVLKKTATAGWQTKVKGINCLFGVSKMKPQNHSRGRRHRKPWYRCKKCRVSDLIFNYIFSISMYDIHASYGNLKWMVSSHVTSIAERKKQPCGISIWPYVFLWCDVSSLSTLVLG